MDISASMLNSVFLVILAAVFSGAITWTIANKKASGEAMEQRDKRITELERQLSLVSQSVVPISTAFQAILIKELTHFHTPVMDRLMEKLGPPNLLSAEEEVALIAALEQRTKDMGSEISDSERDAASMLPLVIKRARKEASMPLADGTLKVVLIPEIPPERHPPSSDGDKG